MATTHIEIEGKISCGVRISGIVRLYAVTLAEYEKDYPKIATSRWRVVCLRCERKASVMTGLPRIGDLTCQFCNHPVKAHQTYADSYGLMAMCRDCPNRITKIYGYTEINFVSHVLPICVLIKRRVEPEDRDPLA